MNIWAQLSLQWAQMTRSQRQVILVITVVAVIVMLAGWSSALFTWVELRDVRRQKATAERDAAEALRSAAKIATAIRIKEKELDAIKEKRDERTNELDHALDRVDRDKSDYDRVRNTRRIDTSAERLCAELAALGYPCRDN